MPTGFFQVFMGVLCFVYLILALRTNLVFVGIFFTLVCAFGCLSGSYWHAAQGATAIAGRLQVAGGAFCFVTCMLGWWIFAAIMLAALDFPFQLPGKHMMFLPQGSSYTNTFLPVGDLSHIITGASEKAEKNA